MGEEQVRDVMTADPATVSLDTTVTEAATAMRDGGFGSVVVVEDEEVRGILTDRDITVRAVAEGQDPDETKVGDICSSTPTCLSPQDSVKDAIETMREEKVRRVPVVDDGRPVGIVSLGDLAADREPRSVLGTISAAPPND
jgi:CBS domain-containing protein